MGGHNKRVYNEMADGNLSGNWALESPRARQRFRRTHKCRTTLSFNQLNEYYNSMEVLDDILEDYLSPQKLKDIMPLVLDTSSGTWENVSIHSYQHMELSAGISVMLINETFLRIQDILMDHELGNVVLRGQRFIQTSHLQPILDDGNDDKELFWDLKDVKGSEICIKGQSLVDVPLRMVERVVKLHLSNYERPNGGQGDTFFCRWKLTRYYQDYEGSRKSIELAIERLCPFEADREFRISDHILKLNWRGNPTKDSDGLYTALDGFCCSGGWSRGATMAGDIKVVRSFDMDEDACKSYSANFPETNCLNVDVFDYCFPDRLSTEIEKLATTPEYVDIAHYSTPCQFFSPAHTIDGGNDEKNFAASFCLSSLLDKDRPRVVTFENTSGLERCHFRTLKAIFGQITSRGYSIRFSTLNLANWGLPQNRKRLIMLASWQVASVSLSNLLILLNSPGEPLPTFPEPTHSDNAEIPGTLPWVTILETIKCIPWNGWQNHNPNQMKKTELPTKQGSLANTITCSGGNQIKHPAGRQFTICEYQLLQGFPLHHRFAKGFSRQKTLRQIGNAFPPLFVKRLLRHVRKQLQVADGINQSDDADEFMSTEELREQEIAQFFVDHEKLPEGSRANVLYTDDADNFSEDDLDQEETTSTEEEDLIEVTGPITFQRHISSGSDSSTINISDDSVEEVTKSSGRLNDIHSAARSHYSYRDMLGLSLRPTSPFKPSKSARSARKRLSSGTRMNAHNTQSLPIRTKRPAADRSSSPDTSSSSASQSGNSMEDAIELE